MKTYKTWEVIKMIGEDHKLRFYDSEERVILYKNGELNIKYLGENSLLDLDETWELIREPVLFEDALKAFMNGQAVTCELMRNKARYRKLDINGVLIDEEGDAISAKEILEGAWFVESED